MGSAIAFAIFLLAAIGVLIHRWHGAPRATEETATEEHGMAWFVLFLLLFMAAISAIPWLRAGLAPLIASWPEWAQRAASFGVALVALLAACVAAEKILFRKD